LSLLARFAHAANAVGPYRAEYWILRPGGYRLWFLDIGAVPFRLDGR
jgi:hypothetical protein